MPETQEYFNYEDADAGAVADLLEIVAGLDDDETLDSPIPAEGKLGERQPSDAEPTSTERWETIATAMISDVEAWLSQDPGVALARNVARIMPTSKISVPELARCGYHSVVEVEADLDCERRTADITVLLKPLDPEGRPGMRIKVLLATTNAERCSAMLSRFGVVRFESVPVTDASPQDLTFTWLGREAT